MPKPESEQIKEIFQYIFNKKKVLETELINIFGKNTPNLLKKGLPHLKALGMMMYYFKNENSEKVYVIGLDQPNEHLNLTLVNKQTLAVFFIVSYYIYKQQPNERALWDEISVAFEKFLKEINSLINDLHWLVLSDDGYLYLDPVGKFVLVKFIAKNKETGNRKIIDLVESYIQ
ncbi:MAG: hypothetical protein K9W44_04625 [Candidatus Lokiarchaeota archaeon]|nr:hypothetical protein [Candidatus Harpocratesius repetitus]